MIVGLLSCVPKPRYDELQQTLNYYRAQVAATDSLAAINRQLRLENDRTQQQLRQQLQQLEKLTATNISLNRSYQEILNRYNQLINQNQDVLTVSSYEKQSLQQELAARESEIDRKERSLAQLEYQLRQREDELRRLESGNANINQTLAARDQRIRDLQTRLANQRERLRSLRVSVDQALRGVQAQDLSVVERNGRLYLSLSQRLLFPKNSAELDRQGIQALQQLATVLRQHPDITITVEGHTDSDGTADYNWDLSVDRATAVAKILTAYGADPRRVTAAGHAFYNPVAPNDTPQNKALNRRTDIILAPDLEDFYRMLGE